ncbi:MAG: NAD(P)-dependent oxidoreductase [Thermoguttaceae bacterium]|nr:NAD(P)-dependent oxidoreductase [Thermoguttaceae bacterium]
MKNIELPDRMFLKIHMSQFADALAGKTVLITGATGFFGKWLLESAIAFNQTLHLEGEKRLKVVALSRNPGAFLERFSRFSQYDFIQFLAGDVRTFDLENVNVDYVIHAATDASAKLEQENPDEMYSVVVHGTQRALDVARKCGASRFLLTSSGAVYGPQLPEMSHIPESYVGTPVTAYGQGKAIAEQMTEHYADRFGFQSHIARCFAFVGPYLNLDIHFAIGNFIRNGLNGEPIVIKGDGTPTRSYLYASELTIWLWTILLRGENHCVYNVGSDDAVTIKELAQRVASRFDVPPEIQVLGTPDPSKPRAQYVPSVDKIRNELGLEQTITLEDALDRTIEFNR